MKKKITTTVVSLAINVSTFAIPVASQLQYYSQPSAIITWIKNLFK